MRADRERRVGRREVWLYAGQEEGAVGKVVGSESRWLPNRRERYDVSTQYLKFDPVNPSTAGG
jgi:hypothetical protein